MSQETEAVLDRRMLRRRLTLWRGLGIAGLVIALGALALRGDDPSGLFAAKHIARVTIEGTITDDRDQLEMLRKIGESDKVAGLLIFVNSPGGTTTGGEALFEQLRTVAAKKPVVAQFGTIAASAGYIVGLGTDYIVARGNTITGSVGVIVQWPEVVELLGKVGIKMNQVKSGELKASPSPFEPLDEGGRRVMAEMINDGYQWFIGLVEQRRGVKSADIPGLQEGRVFSGREALSLKLVDEIGGEREARRWLEDVKGIEKDLKIMDWKPEKAGTFGLGAAIAALGTGVWGGNAQVLSELAHRLAGGAAMGLDGMVSVWQPSEK